MYPLVLDPGWACRGVVSSCITIHIYEVRKPVFCGHTTTLTPQNRTRYANILGGIGSQVPGPSLHAVNHAELHLASFPATTSNPSMFPPFNKIKLDSRYALRPLPFEAGWKIRRHVLGLCSACA